MSKFAQLEVVSLKFDEIPSNKCNLNIRCMVMQFSTKVHNSDISPNCWEIEGSTYQLSRGTCRWRRSTGSHSLVNWSSFWWWSWTGRRRGHLELRTYKFNIRADTTSKFVITHYFSGNLLFFIKVWQLGGWTLLADNGNSVFIASSDSIALMLSFL